MSRFRGQRRLTPAERSNLDSTRVANLNYVLRRYGGLDVYIPRIIGTDPTDRPGPAAVVPAMGGTETSTSQSNFSLAQQARPPPGPYGNYTPLFKGRFVLGPEKGLFFLSLFLMLGIMLLIITEKESIETLCGGPMVFVTGLVLCACSTFTFFHLGITDPGVVPKNYSLQELLVETTEFRSRHPLERFHRYCRKCRAYRPPRTFHCSRCQVCIRQQDLHLFSGGICVGERNRRVYFFTVIFQTLLGVYLVATNLVIYVTVRQQAAKHFSFETIKTVESLVGCLSGFMILFMPQSGILMFIYRIYLMSVGRTAREEYRKFRYFDAHDCVVDRRTPCMNIFHFFFQTPLPSVFRRRANRIDPESFNPIAPTEWQLDQIRRTAERDPNRRHVDRFALNRRQFENIDLSLISLSHVADDARGRRSTSSVPLFEQEMYHPTQRIKIPRKSKPSSIIKQQISAYEDSRYRPRATISRHKRRKLALTLSDGNFPRTNDDSFQEMIQLARATQLRRIIQMILMRDRPGLIEMSRRVNIAALVGMNRFDPDNLQLLELNNGLPMIAPRRREADQGVNQPRLGAGVLGIPQMVAAGLLPTARDLADSVESMVGRGRIRRLPPVGRQRYIPITVVDPPLARRAVNEVDFRGFIPQRTPLSQVRTGVGGIANTTTTPLPEVVATNNVTENLHSSPSQPPVTSSVPQIDSFPARGHEEDRNNNSATLPPQFRNFVNGQSSTADTQQ
ncbi:Palmitoyltransferase ZDHHC9 [Orchesella cincta]|uniref:Palmitoyltransferase n=1 Tax=Orchesella cincta TaxID=48709 RepID=A0A1D2MHM0_ORCCI|nr:Palmitoyltransferase ZDHHC9 [Orchesella cincta]